MFFSLYDIINIIIEIKIWPTKKPVLLKNQ